MPKSWYLQTKALLTSIDNINIDLPNTYLYFNDVEQFDYYRIIVCSISAKTRGKMYPIPTST